MWVYAVLLLFGFLFFCSLFSVGLGYILNNEFILVNTKNKNNLFVGIIIYFFLYLSIIFIVQIIAKNKIILFLVILIFNYFLFMYFLYFFAFVKKQSWFDFKEWLIYKLYDIKAIWILLLAIITYSIYLCLILTSHNKIQLFTFNSNYLNNLDYFYGLLFHKLDYQHLHFLFFNYVFPFGVIIFVLNGIVFFLQLFNSKLNLFFGFLINLIILLICYYFFNSFNLLIIYFLLILLQFWLNENKFKNNIFYYFMLSSSSLIIGAYLNNSIFYLWIIILCVYIIWQLLFNHNLKLLNIIGFLFPGLIYFYWFIISSLVHNNNVLLIIFWILILFSIPLVIYLIFKKSILFEKIIAFAQKYYYLTAIFLIFAFILFTYLTSQKFFIINSIPIWNKILLINFNLLFKNIYPKITINNIFLLIICGIILLFAFKYFYIFLIEDFSKWKIIIKENKLINLLFLLTILIWNPFSLNAWNILFSFTNKTSNFYSILSSSLSYFSISMIIYNLFVFLNKDNLIFSNKKINYKNSIKYKQIIDTKKHYLI